MVNAYQITGLDFHAFMPLIESLIDSGDLQPGDTAIAYPVEESSAKAIYVVSTLPILKNSVDVKTLDQDALAELCRLVKAGTYATWGNKELFSQDSFQPPSGQ